MSAIYFHSPDGNAQVRGTERYYMGSVISDLFNVSLGISDDAPLDSFYKPILVPGHYLHSLSGRQFNESLRCALSVMTGDVFLVEGEAVRTFSAQLNTSLNIGGDQVKLMARLHGQCEIHCYIEGQNRNWIAAIIERGIAIGLFRESENWKTGWSSVVEFLRSRDDVPVVTSYSVCEQFPNSGAANWQPPLVDGEKDWDAWYELSGEEQWRLSLEHLRQDGALEMKPDNWPDYYFGNGLDGFGIADEARRITSKPKAS